MNNKILTLGRYETIASTLVSESIKENYKSLLIYRNRGNRWLTRQILHIKDKISV